MSDKVELGDLVKDTVSGFTGIAIADHNYLAGCRRISIQPKVLDDTKDYKLPETQAFDEPQVEILEKQVVRKQQLVPEPEPQLPGGPERYSDTSRPEG